METRDSRPHSIGPTPNALSRVQAWLDQLRVMGELPYPSVALMINMVTIMRGRLNAVFGSYGWVRGEHLEPDAFWVEVMKEGPFRWFKDNYLAVFDETPLRMTAETDGDNIWQLTRLPEFELNPMQINVFNELGARWACCLPFFSSDRSVHGFLYFYRARHQPTFSKEDMSMLRRARTAIGPMDREGGPYAELPPARREPVATAQLVFDGAGRLRSRSQNALEMLFLANGPRVNVLDWAGYDVEALPADVRTGLQALLGTRAPPGDQFSLVATKFGSFRFETELLAPVSGSPDDARWLVTVNHLEPEDLTLARRMANWALTPQEKRILIASTRDVGLAEVANSLRLTPSSLKSYVNQLLRRHEVSTRRELVDRILVTPVPEGPESA